MDKTYLLCWRDIPIRVVGPSGERPLSDRFAHILADVAHREGLAEGQEAYATQWRRAPITLGGDLDEIVDRIESAYDPKMLAELGAAGGHYR